MSCIGIFDSGVGGLSVLAALEALLPNEDFVYFADHAHFPYGEKTNVELKRFSSQITGFLLSQGIQLLVVACHTASVVALSFLQATFPIPIIGMIQPTLDALEKKTKRIGIMATKATIDSGIYQKAILKEIPDAVLFPSSCPELALKIEQGEDAIQSTIQECVKPLLNKGIQVVLLGCTHYPLILRQIEEELDSETTVLNPALHIAEAVKAQLKTPQSPSHVPYHRFYVSGEIEAFRNFLEKHPPKANFEMHFFQ